ncbi:DUF262 domain-containing protein [Ileibacterium valens]|uniref:DUF262 domain-containing protein n=1 Tax=Ileibacterium valens TaxID=1862668 RepID=UPI0025B73987|nr:DUF262 domain-containing protein [Ileibacterium valens]
MIKGKQNWTVSNIKKMYESKQVLSFSHPIQRSSELWDIMQKSLLIHSMLANYPIPNIYVLREDSRQVDDKGKHIFIFSVIDGKQRLTNVLSFLRGEYALSDNVPDVTIEEETYSIAGKYFADLDEPVKYELQRYKFEIYSFEECSNDEVEEIFFRLNNATPLTKAQVAKAKVGTSNAIFINKLLGTRFMSESCNFSRAQRKNSDDQRVILQSAMLFDRNYKGMEITDLSEKSIMEYAESIKGNFSAQQENILLSAFEYLSDAFPPEINKNLRKIVLPMVIYMADYALDKDVKGMYFRQWLDFFFSEDVLLEDFNQNCGSGSTKLVKVNARLAIMAMSFANYFETDVPEELAELVAEVKEQIAEKAEEQAAIPDAADALSEELQEETEAEDIPENESEDKEEEQGECDPLPDHIPTEEVAEG